MDETAYIALKDVRKAFGPKKVLNGINLTVPKGRSLVVIGGSGTGKSVMIKTILGIVRPDSGSIEIGGPDPPGKAIGCTISDRDGLGLILIGDDGQDGTEDFLLRHTKAGGDMAQYGRAHKIAAIKTLRPPLTTRCQCGAFSHADTDKLLDLVELLLLLLESLLYLLLAGGLAKARALFLVHLVEPLREVLLVLVKVAGLASQVAHLFAEAAGRLLAKLIAKFFHLPAGTGSLVHRLL